MKRAITGIIAISAAILLATVYQNCSPLHTPASISNGSLSINEAYFAPGSVYPLVSKHCAQCHSQAGGTSPMFGSEVARDAVNAAVALVDFNNPENSRFVQRLKVDQHNCWSGLDKCESDGNTMKRAIERWYRYTKKSDQPGSGFENYIALEPLTIPADTPDLSEAGVDEDDFAELIFSLSSLGAGFEQAEFVLKIQLRGGEYRVEEPSLRGLSGPVFVKDLRLLVNGSYSGSGDTYKSIDFEITDDQGVLHKSAIFLKNTKGVGQDQIQPRFRMIQSGSRPCFTPQEFEDMVYPGLVQSCAGCHGPDVTPQGGFQFRSTAAEACEDVLEHVNFDIGTLPLSPLIRNPVEGTGAMDPVEGFAEQHLKDWQDWILLEYQ